MLSRLPTDHLIHIGLLHGLSSQLNLLLKISIQFLLVNRTGHQGLRYRRRLAADSTLLTHVASRALWPNVHRMTLSMILILHTLNMCIRRRTRRLLGNQLLQQLVLMCLCHLLAEFLEFSLRDYLHFLENSVGEIRYSLLIGLARHGNYLRQLRYIGQGDIGHSEVEIANLLQDLLILVISHLWFS